MNTIEQGALVAARPALIAIIQAVQQFETDIGPDPTKWLMTVAPAKLKLIGSIGLQFPTIASAEVAAGEGLINQVSNGWIAKLNALPAPTAGAAT